MQDSDHAGTADLRIERNVSKAALLIMFAALVAAPQPSNAQINGIPPSVTSIPNHVPPFLPNAPASVTSLGPYGYGNARPSNVPYRNPNGINGRFNGRRRNGYGGYGYGGAVIPYYYLYPSYDAGYDTGGGGGPYMYSGPPDAQAPPAQQTLHIIVDQPPAGPTLPREEAYDDQPVRPTPPPPDMKPGVPTVLVFRDGHQQEVLNYAIMGQTVYIFGDRTKKIALADLDIPATVKVNDDQGVQFEIPKAQQKAKPPKNTSVPLQNVPSAPPTVPTNVASALP